MNHLTKTKSISDISQKQNPWSIVLSGKRLVPRGPPLGTYLTSACSHCSHVLLVASPPLHGYKYPYAFYKSVKPQYQGLQQRSHTKLLGSKIKIKFGSWPSKRDLKYCRYAETILQLASSIMGSYNEVDTSHNSLKLPSAKML